MTVGPLPPLSLPNDTQIDRDLHQQPNKWPSFRTRRMEYSGGYVDWGGEQTEMDQGGLCVDKQSEFDC